MPWNDNNTSGPWGDPPKDEPGKASGGGSNGPRRSGPGGPRRPAPGPGGPGGPDLDQIVHRLRGHANDWFGGPGGVKPAAIAAVAGVAALLWALSGVYIVQPDEEGVVTTFGAFSRRATPGLRYHLPSPIEQVEKVSVTSLNRIDVGGTEETPIPEESLMLTGDENIVDLNFSVQWRVADAAKYLFNLRDRDAAVKAVAESAMREVIGKNKLNPILSTGRGQIQSEARDLMQRILDSYQSGVDVVEVQIRNSQPPAQVIAAYQDQTKADQDAQSATNEAQTYRNRVVNEAKGDASRITQSAEGYSEQVTREAQGEAARFNLVYDQYRKAPGVTRQRLYTETMQRVLQNSNKVVVDGKGASAPIILPPDVFRPRSGGGARAVPAYAAPAASPAYQSQVQPPAPGTTTPGAGQ
jgi:membrane protease subunit HflK